MWDITFGGVSQRNNIERQPEPVITLPFNERGTAEFTCKPGFIPDLREEVVIYDQDGITPIFGGIVHDRDVDGFYSAAQTRVTCVDWTWYFDRITVDSGALTGTITLKAVLEWFQMNYLDDYGFTLDPAQATGPSIAVTGFTWERMYVSDAFRGYVTPASGGWVFRVRPDKVWGFYDPSTVTTSAPFSIGNASAPVREPWRVTWTDSAADYATKIILVCGGTGTREKTETFEVDAQIIADGFYDTDCRSTPLNAPTATINGSPATIGGAGSQLIWSYNGGVNGVARVSAGTYIPTLGDDIAITYTAQFPFEVVADALETPPIVLTEQRDDITDRTTGQAVADGLLSKHYQQPKEITIPTITPGLEPGQVIAIERSDRALAAQNALITEVAITLLTDDTWAYSAKAISGVYQGSPLDFWRGGGRGTGGGTTVSVTYTGGTNPTIGQELSRVNDTNVTLALSGSPATALLAPTTLTLGWTGTLAANRLNSNVVQAVANDINVTGSINTQTLILGWSGQLSVSRGGTGLSTLAAGRIPYGSGTSAFQSSSNLSFDGTTLSVNALSVSNGSATFAADANPATNYTSNLGSLSTKYLTLHAAELWVETLVAQDTIATIGGRVLVGPTTTLTADLAAAATTIQVKHNQITNGDRIYMEANGKVEWMAVTSAASGSAGAYTYSVTRNLDGSGAHDWFAGDAVFNTGTTGDGFIDLYSVDGVLSGAGPTIVGNVRTGTTFNNIEPRWAVGNLNGIADYVDDVYGAFFGSSSGSNVCIDATNGIRIRNGSTTKIGLDSSGNAFFVQGDVSLSEDGIIVGASTTGSFVDVNAYRFGNAGLSTGAYGLYGAISDLGASVSQKTLRLQSINTDTASDFSGVELLAQGKNASGTTQTAFVRTHAGGTSGAVGNVVIETRDGFTVGQFEFFPTYAVCETSLGVGISPSYPLDVAGTASTVLAAHVQHSHASSPRGLGIKFTTASPNDGSNEFIVCEDAGPTVRFYVSSNGGVGNFSANNVNLSDDRAKVIRGPARSQRALFRRLQLVEGRYNDTTRDVDDVMVTAQNVAQVYPELVEDFAGTGLLGVREHGLLMRAFKVIQELDAEIDALSDRLAAVEKRG